MPPSQSVQSSYDELYVLLRGLFRRRIHVQARRLATLRDEVWTDRDSPVAIGRSKRLYQAQMGRQQRNARVVLQLLERSPGRITSALREVRRDQSRTGQPDEGWQDKEDERLYQELARDRAALREVLEELLAG